MGNSEMKKTMTVAALSAACAMLAGQCLAAPEPELPVLRLAGRTELPGYSGDFDHFAYDLAGNRLFLAGEDQGTLEVFELSSGKHLRTVHGFGAPHAIIDLPGSGRMVVTDSGAGLSKILERSSYRAVGSIALRPGADSALFDPAGKSIYVVNGGKNGRLSSTYVSRLDPASGKLLAEAQFDTGKIEAMAVERGGKRLFVNVTGRNELAVLDKQSMVVLQSWSLRGGQQNASLAFDEAHQRLFAVTRKPFKLLVIDAQSGAEISAFPAPTRTNEAIFDAHNHRLYLAGDDYIGVFAQTGAERYRALAPVPSAHGAKTAILVPELGRLYVAVSPGEGKTGAAVLRYDVMPASH
jgi:DNA-binding beta-propeller fold protein YncE